MTVYSKIEEADLNNAILNYGLKNSKLISYEEISEQPANSSYNLQFEDKNYILTVFEKTNEEDILLQSLIYDSLTKNNFCSPKLIKTIFNEPFIKIKENLGILTEYLQGSPKKHFSRENMEEIGYKIGQMHNILSEIKAPYTKFSFKNKEKDEYLSTPNISKGLCHNNLFKGAFLFSKNNRLSGISCFKPFYFGPLIYDLGTVIADCCFEIDGAINTTLTKDLITSYEKSRLLSDEEKEALPNLSFLAATKINLRNYGNKKILFNTFNGIC